MSNIPFVFHPALEQQWRKDYQRHRYINQDYLLDIETTVATTHQIANLAVKVWRSGLAFINKQTGDLK